MMFLLSSNLELLPKSAKIFQPKVDYIFLVQIN